jgi:hypothetical protein
VVNQKRVVEETPAFDIAMHRIGIWDGLVWIAYE